MSSNGLSLYYEAVSKQVPGGLAPSIDILKQNFDFQCNAVVMLRIVGMFDRMALSLLKYVKQWSFFYYNEVCESVHGGLAPFLPSIDI
eukprot:scaffold13220_cov91-Cylindrotheca_fusiformis.AAC.7